MLQKEIESTIRKRFKYYKGEVYIKHIEHLVKDLLKIAGIDIDYEPSDKHQKIINDMVKYVIDQEPSLVDLDNIRGWINNNYECKSCVPPFV